MEKVRLRGFTCHPARGRGQPGASGQARAGCWSSKQLSVQEDGVGAQVLLAGLNQLFITSQANFLAVAGFPQLVDRCSHLSILNSTLASWVCS